MADRTSSVRVNPHRRKAATQVSLSSSPAPSGPSTPLATQPRLKAHINPANIIGGSHSPAAALPSPRPGVVRVPSNTSIRADGSARSTPRSEVGGPSASRASSALGHRPLVARAGAGARATPPAHRSGASLPGSAMPSGASTPTVVHVRRSSSVLGNTSTSSTPSSRSPQPDQGAFNATTGSRFRANLAGAGASDVEVPLNARPVHVRSASFTPGPRSDSSNSQLSTNSRTLSRQASGQSSPPRPTVSRNPSTGSVGVPRRRSNESSPRLVPTAAGTPPSSQSPSSSTDIPRGAMRQATEGPRLSALAEVTTSSENLTQHLLPTTSAPISSSLLSPSTLTPRALPSPPTIEQGALNGNEQEHEPSSNHSSPVRPSLQLASPSTALHAHLAHLGLGSLATASAPTSPRSGNGALGLERKRAPLPWNPMQSAHPSFPAPPESPELRTVALPIMTPARTPEASEYLSLKPASFGSRRFSSGSESGQGETSVVGLRKSISPRARVSPEAVMPWSNLITNGKSRKQLPTSRQWAGSTGDESSYDHSDDHHSDDDIDLEAEIDGNLLELSPSAEMELARDKWERKIADLEISNSSLMNINRMLETTKVKQQGEIVRLRRALRDARSGVPERPVLEPAPLSAEEDPDSSGSWGDDEMEDPEVEKRWDRLRDLVSAMRKAGEDAVERGRQEVKPHQRVLGWLEVEAMGIGRSEDTTRAHSEVDPAETVSGATETTEDSTNPDVTDTTSERSDTAPTEIGLVARVRRPN